MNWTMACQPALTALGKLKNAASIHERETARSDVEAALDEIIINLIKLNNSAYNEPSLDELLITLRDNRLFEISFSFASSLSAAGVTSDMLREQHAQAAIELGEFAVALQILNTAQNDFKDSNNTELQEKISGLQGRLYKQMYVDVAKQGQRPNPDHLRAAITYYGEQYSKAFNLKESHYHGVNLIALLWRAEHDGIDLKEMIRRFAPEHETSQDIAKELLDDLLPYVKSIEAAARNKKTYDYWALASCGEALLAFEKTDNSLSENERSAHWISLAAHLTDSPFHIVGTARQLEEVWLVQPNDEAGGRALSILRSRAAFLGSNTTFGAGDALNLNIMKAEADRREQHEANASGDYERVIDGIKPRTIASMYRVLEKAKSVARINEPVAQQTVGTGFVISGHHLGEKFAHETVFITNAHVVSPNPVDRSKYGAIPPDKVDIEFNNYFQSARIDGLGDIYPRGEPAVFHCKEVIWCSPVEDLDATLMLLKGRDDITLPKPLDVMEARLLGPESKVDTAYIIGYPNGGDLSFSDRNNGVRRDKQSDKLAFGWAREHRKDWMFVHYTASSFPGNSGSPVFTNDVHDVYAVHHFGPREHHRGGDLDSAPDRQRIRMLNGRVDTMGRPVSWVANQGIVLSCILAEAQSQLGHASSAMPFPESASRNRPSLLRRLWPPRV